ncbi:MAG: WYL domain-containing protein [Actinocatenispora sp.]
MNRTERLYALVDELRAAAPSPRSTRWLAERFSVSVRTIERDATALAESGVPVYPVSGPHGGYAVDATHELPSISMTSEEAVAVAIGLARLAGSPFHSAADGVLAKLRARYPGLTNAAAEAVVAQVEPEETAAPHRGQFPAVPVVLQDALDRERVLEIDYSDRKGAVSRREVEPIGFVGTRDSWLLLAWCRLRHGVRGFRIDRIRRANLGAESVTARRDLPALKIPEQVVRRLS